MENDNNINDAGENSPKETLPNNNSPNENASSENLSNENTSSENSQNKNTPVTPKKKFNFFKPFKNSYRQIKSDEERKKKTVLFGWLSILFSFICIGLCYPCVWLGVKGVIFAFTHNLGPLTYLLGVGNIIIAALSVGAALLPYYFWFQGIYLVILQLCLNRRFIGWFALLIWLVSIVGIFMFSLESFLTITGAGHLFL